MLSHHARSEIDQVTAHTAAADYLSVAQLFLKDNCLLHAPMSEDQLKDPVLGHWGTCPTVNLLYAHICRYVRRTEVPTILVLGSGHAAPALLANLYIEGSLGNAYPELQPGPEGLRHLVSQFGRDGRLQTEISGFLPGVINAGGELGMAVGCAVGAVLNAPAMTCFCIVGDGELEAGTSLSAMLCGDLLVPGQDGFLVIMININAYKMGSPSLISTWDDTRLESFFSGLGFHPIICAAEHEELTGALDHVGDLQMRWAEGRTPSLPVLLVRDIKGRGGPAAIGDTPYVGTHTSHKVGALKHPHQVPDSVRIVEDWLRSYDPHRLFHADGRPKDTVLSNLPPPSLRLGRWLETEREALWGKSNPAITSSDSFSPLGAIESPMEALASAVGRHGENRDRGFLVFSPDEADSNLLGDLVSRWSVRGHDSWTSTSPVSRSGRVVEVLNESCCQAFLQGYLQTGRDGIYVTYEAFSPLTSSALAQYLKLVRSTLECAWRTSVPSMKIVLTSSGWRNTFTHQNPDFLNSALSRSGTEIETYFPSDANQTQACMERALRRRDSIDILVVEKQRLPVRRSLDEARQDVECGVWTYDLGDPHTSTPRICLLCIGAFPVREAFSAYNRALADPRTPFLRLVAPVRGSVLSDGSLARLQNWDEFDAVIVICTGYVPVFRGLLASTFDVRSWVFRGYRDALPSSPAEEVTETNGIGCSSLLRFIRGMAEGSSRNRDKPVEAE